MLIECFINNEVNINSSSSYLFFDFKIEVISVTLNDQKLLCKGLQTIYH